MRSLLPELDELMRRFEVRRCVIDALPEIHATRDFARRFPRRVYLNFFNEHQRGSYQWDQKETVVRENHTEALDAAHRLIRDGQVILPRRSPLVEEFASHMSSDAKRLIEDEQTGSQVYRYIKTGTDHFSLAFTYDCIAWSNQTPASARSRMIVGVLTDEEIADIPEDFNLWATY